MKSDMALSSASTLLEAHALKVSIAGTTIECHRLKISSEQAKIRSEMCLDAVAMLRTRITWQEWALLTKNAAR